jgi:hypothetical protein
MQALTFLLYSTEETLCQAFYKNIFKNGCFAMHSYNLMPRTDNKTG